MNITLSEFEAALGEVSFPLAVAVSGGADSLALLLLAHALAQRKGSYVMGLTVDHGLRPASKKEAFRVRDWASERGIDHVVLEWCSEKPATRLQEKAREARHDLLIKWCKKNHFPTLLLGHHQQDQEETFWHRLASGSGLEGLSGMKIRTLREGITVVRPLLGFPKDRLKATLMAANQSWIEDPSNQNERFFRSRLRPFLKEEGLSSARLLKVMKKLQEDADFIQVALHQVLETTVQMGEGGYIRLQKKAFEALHPALAKRLLGLLMQWFSADPYPPRSSQIAVVLEKLKAPSAFTAGGIYWVPRHEEIWLLREPVAAQQGFALAHLQETTLWDKRFWIDPQMKQNVSRETFLAPLGSVPTLRKAIQSSIPFRAWSTLPALWVKGKVVAVPHLCYTQFKCEKDLRKFIYLNPLFHDSLRFTI